MKDSKIEWTDHTFNPWSGCTKVSPGCANCYAETLSKRTGATLGQWGRGAPRKRTGAAYWRGPEKWNRDAAVDPAAIGQDWERNSRPRVFCASLADWLDDEVPIEWLADLLDLIRRTPHLDWLLLTKRPENWRERLLAVASLETGPDVSECGLMVGRWMQGTPPANIWIGTSVEDQQRADERIPHLLRIPARVRFLSMEPLLGPVDLYNHLYHESGGEYWPDGTLPADAVHYAYRDGEPLYRRGIHWVIVGGESGPGARPMHPDWARSLRDQCQEAGVPFFFKQWGEWCQGYHEAADKRRIMGPGVIMGRFGKKSAGRLLDGREWSEFPEVRS